MKSNGQAVSQIINSLKLTNKDSRIPRRYVLRTLKTICRTYIAQRLDTERSLYSDLDLYTTVECFEFQKDDIVKCPFIEFKRCKTLMKSKKPLPELLFGRLGSSIKDVRAIDDFRDFTIIEAKQYRRNQNRKYNDDKLYVYLAPDMHLYIPDEKIYAVNLDFITLETDKVDEISSCKKEECKSGWDYPFICPARLEDAVFKNALQTIATTFGAIIADNNPNGIEKQRTE